MRCRLPGRDQLGAALQLAISVMLVAQVNRWLIGSSGIPPLITPTAATGAILFLVPESIFARTRAVLGGSLISALIGVLVFQAVPNPVIACAFAASGAALAMHVLECSHPPGIAFAVAPIVGNDAVHNAGLSIVLFPIGLDCILLLSMQAVCKGLRRALDAGRSSSRPTKIMHGILAPGQKLRVEVLKDKYGVGASTLREAITRLGGEALVTSEEQRGFRVAGVSLADFTDLSHTRKFIEVEALRQSIMMGDDDWEANLVAAHHRLSKVEQRFANPQTTFSTEFESPNREFHRALIAACPSRWLLQFQGILFQQAERYRRISPAHRDVERDVHSEHEAIVEAALARDVERACLLAGEHIERTSESLTKVFASGDTSVN
jgi:DNA-binding GntR family transcriptional regulator